MRSRRSVLAGVVVAVGIGTTAGAGYAWAAGGDRHHVAGLPISFVLPPSWQALDVPSALTPAIVARLVDADPVAAVLKTSYGKVGIRFIGNEAVHRGQFTANVNVIVERLPAGVSLRSWFFAGSSASLEYAGRTTPITSSGVSGLHYVSTKAEKLGTTRLLTDIYGYALRGRAFLVTFTARAQDQGRYLPGFAASGSSIRFDAG